MQQLPALKGKTALISGGSRGIGSAIAQELASYGCDIIFTYVSDEDSAKKTEARITSLGVRCLPLRCDMRKESDVAELIETTRRKFPRIDYLVNNAGTTKDKTIRNMTLEEWNDVISTNLTGTFLLTKYTLPLLNDGGSIVNISSIVGMDGNFGQANYAASKAGVIAFTKTLAKECAKRKIRANAIAPGFIDTDMISAIPSDIKAAYEKKIGLGRLGTPADVARVALFLLCDDSAYLTGEVLRVDGGLSL